MGIKPLLDIRQVSNETTFVVVLGDICERIPLKHYTFPHTLKKMRGNFGRL